MTIYMVRLPDGTEIFIRIKMWPIFKDLTTTDGMAKELLNWDLTDFACANVSNVAIIANTIVFNCTFPPETHMLLTNSEPFPTVRWCSNLYGRILNPCKILFPAMHLILRPNQTPLSQDRSPKMRCTVLYNFSILYVYFALFFIALLFRQYSVMMCYTF